MNNLLKGEVKMDDIGIETQVKLEEDLSDFEKDRKSEYKKFSWKVTVECLIGNLIIHFIVYSLIYGVLPWLLSAK